jgi:AMMECR1 domain-containing protein
MNGVTINKNINTEINSSHFNLKLGGIFVTLTDMLTDELRGCIGHTYSNNNIYNDIIELTNSAIKKELTYR